ncbi:MAG TPA: TetR/AcrR family transcriptional regulator [Blastocatellia bacterium]|nr:TetR/AcrR family transcriptional regulator [Blastocatellia bacterium]HMX28222.1 TetR/AcrR family transcriptional regulator [Blastocatellia bacterium]HMZ20566.1 TetR/AcrR family transcriptional regulator [Blastocatellia bacterium]
MKPQKKQSRLSGTERVDQIYSVAAQMICERGFDACSMKDIADAVGITKAGVYHFIPSKKELLFAIMNYGMDTLEAAVLNPAREVADAEQRLRLIVTNHSMLIARASNDEGHDPVTILVEEEMGLSPAHRRRIKERKREYLELVRGSLEELQAEGKLKEIDITAAAFSLLGMIHWLARWFRPDGRLSREQVAEELCKIALGGMLRSESDAAAAVKTVKQNPININRISTASRSERVIKKGSNQ